MVDGRVLSRGGSKESQNSLLAAQEGRVNWAAPCLPALGKGRGWEGILKMALSYFK